MWVLWGALRGVMLGVRGVWRSGAHWGSERGWGVRGTDRVDRGLGGLGAAEGPTVGSGSGGGWGAESLGGTHSTGAVLVPGLGWGFPP